MKKYVLTKYGEPQNVAIRRSMQAKSISIRITHKGTELVQPLKAKALKKAIISG